MRIHTSSNVSHDDILTAASSAEAWAEITEHGSRKRSHAFEVHLTGSSKRRNATNTDYAATWDQWGIFIAAVFEIDPEATMTYYTDAADFHYQTGTRFADGRPADMHGDHTFRWNGSATQCTKCSAVQRNV